MIPVYSFDGAFIGKRKPSRIDELLEAHRVTVARSAKGTITRAYMRSTDGTAATLQQVHTGTKYSYLERLPSGRRCYTLKRVTERICLPTS